MMSELKEVRIDKWLCAVRIFKTRSLAARALTGGKIKLNGAAAKPNKTIKPGDLISMKKEGRTLEYHVTGLIDRRVSAKLAVENYSLTVDADLPETMRELTQIFHELDKTQRRRGKPTKKERRQIDRLMKDED